jgi:hypothetical protein
MPLTKHHKDFAEKSAEDVRKREATKARKKYEAEMAQPTQIKFEVPQALLERICADHRHDFQPFLNQAAKNLIADAKDIESVELRKPRESWYRLDQLAPVPQIINHDGVPKCSYTVVSRVLDRKKIPFPNGNLNFDYTKAETKKLTLQTTKGILGELSSLSVKHQITVSDLLFQAIERELEAEHISVQQSLPSYNAGRYRSVQERYGSASYDYLERG